MFVGIDEEIRECRDGVTCVSLGNLGNIFLNFLKLWLLNWGVIRGDRVVIFQST